MKTITNTMITSLVARLVTRAAIDCRDDVHKALESALTREESPLGKKIITKILTNHDLASRERLPLCQDTGIDTVFVTLGRDIHLVGNLNDAINEGIALSTKQAHLRSSLVSSPLERLNTQTNTPVFIHLKLAEGNELKIQVLPKGAGCENVGKSTFLLPSAGEKGIRDFVTNAVKEAAGKACPPYIISIAAGGDAAEGALQAKRALLHPLDWLNPNPRAAQIEQDLLLELNRTGIGPMGLGGSVTALRVFCTLLPCHIASFPLTVIFSCHALRSAEGSL